MQFTFSTVASLLLISGAIALPQPRNDKRDTKINYLGGTERPDPEVVASCFALGTSRYPYLTKMIDCICNCGGEECADPNVGDINIDFKYDRMLPDACGNAFQKVEYGTSASGEKLTMADTFDDEGKAPVIAYRPTEKVTKSPPSTYNYGAWLASNSE